MTCRIVNQNATYVFTYSPLATTLVHMLKQIDCLNKYTLSEHTVLLLTKNVRNIIMVLLFNESLNCFVTLCLCLQFRTAARRVTVRTREPVTRTYVIAQINTSETTAKQVDHVFLLNIV